MMMAMAVICGPLVAALGSAALMVHPILSSSLSLSLSLFLFFLYFSFPFSLDLSFEKLLTSAKTSGWARESKSKPTTERASLLSPQGMAGLVMSGRDDKC